jgi:hypothetical protein
LKGELDIWANGQKITSVRGNIGYKLKIGDDIDLVGPYFKFGLYRVKLPGEVRFHLDVLLPLKERTWLPGFVGPR